MVYLRKSLLLPLDDLLALTREFLCPGVSRSGLDRCLRRHGVSNLRVLKPQSLKPTHQSFKAYEPGYLHMDIKYLPQMADQTKRSYLFVAIEHNKSVASAKRFLKAVYEACPFKITKILTDNGKEFTDRLFSAEQKHPSGEHEFDKLCQAFGIEHRLTRPSTPQTNGIVERFNRRISDILQTHHFKSSLDLEQTLLRYVALYNQQLSQTALRNKTPMQEMKEWYLFNPHLFKKVADDRGGGVTHNLSVIIN